MVSLALVLINFSFGFSHNFSAVSGDSVNIVDNTGKKQGRWIVTNLLAKKDCYAEDQKVEEGKYVDSKKTGFWKEFYCNKSIKSKITYENNKANGYAIIYHENGKVKEEGMWRNNRWIGNYKLYYPNGQVQQAFNFNPSGKREGKQTYYHENGQVMIEGNWEGGKEAGEVKEYYDNGDIKSVKDFSTGKIDPTSIETFEPKKPLAKKSGVTEELDAPVVVVLKNEKDNSGKMFNGEGYWQLYNSNKQVTKDGMFLHNRFMEGKAYFYDDNGLLLRIAIYKGGKYIGDGITDDE